MAYSVQRAVSDGTLSTITLDIDFFAKEHISVLVADRVLPNDNYTFSWIGSNTIKIVPNVANGAEVLIRRSTPYGECFHNFHLGAVFKDETMDENFKQVLFLTQEAIEGQTSTDFYTDLNFHGYKLRNVGPAVAAFDAIPYSQYQGDALGAYQSRLAADASRAAAAASAISASTSASSASASDTTATTKASEAATSAANAATSAANAAASTIAASTSATNAATSATAAAGSATSASNSATLAQSFAASVVPASALYKVDKTTPALTKTGASALAIKAGTTVYLSGGVVSFASQTAVAMPALTAGTDYSVWVKPDGSAVAVADPYSSPASAPVSGALKIGGFHYGLVAPGTTLVSGLFNTTTNSPLISMVWAQSDVDAIAGINQWSIWDLSFRPLCDPRGMACVTNANGKGLFWFDIYFCGTQHITNGTSAYNTDVASGTVQPVIPIIFGGNGTTKYTTLTWYEANEIAFSHKKRLISYQEFATAAFGVTENQSLGGASSTIPATARKAGYTSRWGGEQMTGHHLVWGNVSHGASGSAWVSGPARGQSYGTAYGAFFGGGRDHAASSGSRCAHWNLTPWDSVWSIGLRAACDHFNGAL